MNTPFRLAAIRLTLILLVLSVFSVDIRTYAQDMSTRYYKVGNAVYTNIWVDPVNGSDSNNGSTRASALHTVNAAWQLIPSNTTLSTAYRIMLCRGNYPESSMPSSNWFELRHGTYTHPVVIQAADGRHTVKIHAFVTFDHCSYIYLINLDFVTDPGYGGGSNIVHYSFSDHLLMRGCTLNGWDGSVKQPQETLKANQCQYVYVEDCDISNAFWMGLDYVAVQYGHIQGNKVHDTDNDCLMVKGGSAYLRVEGNEVYNCGQCGLVAGQGTTFGFMVQPWLHYEVYDTKFINNVVHDVQNAGIAARGDYNVLFAYNTFYRIGIDQNSGAGLILCSPGGRLCQGDLDICLNYHNLGGWGQTTIGDEAECIPNRNVFIYDNVFYNPADVRTMYGHFVFFGPQVPPAGTNIPNPVLSDDNLQIKGNIIWDGPSGWPSGIDVGTGCQPSNPTCNETLLNSQNAINTIRPQFIDPAHGDFHPVPSGNIYTAPSYGLPSFAGNDRQQHPLAPLGNLVNTVTRDLASLARSTTAPSGAYSKPGSVPVLMQNSSTRAVTVQWSTGSTVGSSTTFSTIPSMGWIAVDVADFNGDGMPDILFQNSSTYGLALWFTNGTSVTGSTAIVAPQIGLKVVGAGDFNGDGHTDILFQDQNTRVLAVWYMNGGSRLGTGVLDYTPAMGWKAIGAGDFDGDQQPDILLFNASTRVAVIWFCSGITRINSVATSSSVASGWTPVGVADLNGDHLSDIVFRSQSYGLNCAWYMNAASRMETVSLPDSPTALQYAGPR